MPIQTVFVVGFLLLDGNAVPLGPGVFAHSGYLPRDPDVRMTRADREQVVPNLPHQLGRHERVAVRLVDHRMLVAKIAVEGFKVVGQCDGGVSALVGDDVSMIGQIREVGRELPPFLDEFDVRTRQAEAHRLVHALALGGYGATYQNV